MVRNSLKYVSWKDYKAVTSDLKRIYQAVTEDAALQALEVFATTFFSYPVDIRKAIYTTNAIESLNSVIRHATKKRKIFPTDDSVRKVVYLAIEAASKKWNMPIRDWRTAMSRFLIEFEDRLGNFM